MLQHDLSQRPQGNAKEGLGCSLRRFARSARAEFLAKTARQRKGGAGGFFASLCALCESRISREDRNAAQRGFWGFLCVALRAWREQNFSQRAPCAAKIFTHSFLCVALRALREQNFSRRPQGSAKGVLGGSLRRFARLASLQSIMDSGQAEAWS